MKKISKFFKKGTLVTALCLLVSGSLILHRFQFGDDSCSTYAFMDPDTHERPVGPEGTEQD